MTTSYTVNLSKLGNTIFSGLFTVNNSNQLVQEFYQTFPLPAINNDRLLNAGTVTINTMAMTTNDNQYLNGQYFTNRGTSFNTTDLTIDGFNITKMTLFYAQELFSFSSYNVVQVEHSGGTILYTTGQGYDYTIEPEAPSCYNKGAKILCLNKQFEEEYIPIEHLRKGDLVKSYKHGYRRVDLIGKNLMKNNPDIWSYCMYKMEKTETNGLLEDLIVTGGHVILVDDLGIYKEQNEKIFGTTPMIDDKYLLSCSLSKDFTKIENTDLYTYYHFTLENNGSNDERFGVWANGILSETVSKHQFTDHNYTLL